MELQKVPKYKRMNIVFVVKKCRRTAQLFGEIIYNLYIANIHINKINLIKIII